MSKLTITDIRRFISLKQRLKEIRMGIKSHQRVITDREAKGRKVEAQVYRDLIEKARVLQKKLGPEALKLRELINSGSATRRRYADYVGMLRLLGHGDILSITINQPHGKLTTPPHIQVAQMLKLTHQNLLLDIDHTSLSDDEKTLMVVAQGKSNITAKEALVLSKYFNTGVDYWLDKQKSYDSYLLNKDKYPTIILR